MLSFMWPGFERRCSTFGAVLLGAALTACTAEPMHDPAEAQRMTPDAAVQIALIRHFIDEGGDNLSGTNLARKIVCVDLPGTADDSSPLFGYFADREPPVRPASECKEAQWDNDPTSPLWYLLHVPSGEGAILYGIGPIRYDDQGQAWTSVGYYASGLAAGSWTCTLRKAEVWFVFQCEADPWAA